jgi:hypothetical protein
MNATVFPKKLLLLLRGLSFLLFAGWAWQALRWGLPLRSFFWDQSLMEGPVAFLFGMDWRSWAGSARVDGTIRGLEVALGILFLLAGAVSLFARKKGWGVRLLQMGSMGLLLIFLLQWKDKVFSNRSTAGTQHTVQPGPFPGLGAFCQSLPYPAHLPPQTRHRPHLPRAWSLCPGGTSPSPATSCR